MPEFDIHIPVSEAGSYKIEIGTGVLESLWSRLENQFGQHGKFVVTDENLVSAGHFGALVGERGVPHYVITPAGEASKNIDTVVSIIEGMEGSLLGRDTVVVALGGGTVGDIAGFAAAVFKRGVPVVQIPTTTVAQADSSVGGKTGVDSSVSKNAFGAFWQPSAVYIDVATLATLDERQFRAGLVESVKHALIADSEYFEFLERNMDAVLQRETGVLEEIAHHNCLIKGRVVEADPNEKNQRRILNYGHTIGHAVESASGYGLLHGEAVAIGIVGAGMIEIEMGLSGQERLERVKAVLGRLDVPMKAPSDLADSNLMDLIRHDKKAVNKWPRFVLIQDIGKVYCQNGQWAVEVECDLVERVIEELKR